MLRVKIAVIILNYNNAADTIHCIFSVLRSKEAFNHSLIVVDNCSTDGSYERIKEQIRGESREFSHAAVVTEGSLQLPCLPVITLIRSDHNHGYAYGNNLGLKLAMQDPGVSHYWILNNDTEISDNCFGEMSRFIAASAQSTGMWGTLLADFYNRESLQALGAKYYPLIGKTRLLFAGYKISNVNQDLVDRAASQSSYLIGASVVLDKKLIKDVGLLNEQYFLYGEEIDIAVRAKRSGWGKAIISKAVVYHKEGGTTGATTKQKKSRSPFFEYHSCRSKLIYTWLYCRWFYPSVALFIFVNLLKVYRFKLREVFRIGVLLMHPFKNKFVDRDLRKVAV